MWQYIVIGLAVAIGVALHDFHVPGIKLKVKDSERFWKIWYVAIFVALILLAGLRYRVGLDTILLRGFIERYMALPENCKIWTEEEMSLKASRHFLIIAYLKSLGIDMWLWQTICACVLNIPLTVAIRRYTDKWFVAIGFYLIFAYIMLNFETMLEGAAVGMLIWAITDIQKGRLWPYYMKLAMGMFFHLSLISMAILPIFFQKRIREAIWNIKFLPILIISVIALSFLLKYIIFNFAWTLDKLPWLLSFRFSSEYVMEYAREMLSPLNLNWKGYLGFILINIVMPFGVGWILVKKLGKENNIDDEPGRNMLIGTLCLLLSLIGIMMLIANGLNRIGMYLWPMVCIGMAIVLGVHSRRYKTYLIGALAIVSCLNLYRLTAPVKNSGSRYVVEMYLPYSSYLTKGVNYRREWLAYNYYCKYQNSIKCEIYDFGFALFPGEKEIASIIWSEISHASMERYRSSIQGNDSNAVVLPMGEIKGGKMRDK